MAEEDRLIRLPAASAFRFAHPRGAGWRPTTRRERYYRVTMALSGRGMQSTVCRLVAVATASLGLTPLILLASPAGPRSTSGRILAIMVTTCSILMAFGWLRGYWPTRTESRSFVLIGTVCVAVACLVPADPDVGQLSVIVLALLAGYAAFLHHPRLVVFVWTVSAATLAALGWQLAHVDLALVARSVITVGAMNAVAVTAGLVSVRLILADTEADEIESHAVTARPYPFKSTP